MAQTCNMYEPLKYDPVVREVQFKLNCIRGLNHISIPDWNTLQEDGLYGPVSKKAVIAYKKYYNLTDKTDRLDSYAINRIRTTYNDVTSLHYCVITAPEPAKVAYQSAESDSIFGFMDLADGFVNIIVDTIDKMSDVIKKVKDPELLSNKASADEFIKEFEKIAKKMDSTLYGMKQSLQKKWKAQELYDEGIKDSKWARNKTEMTRANKKVYTGGTLLKHEDAQVRKMGAELAKNASEIKIINKIKLKLNPNTILKAGKYVGPLGIAYNAKDVIWDIVWESWHMESAQFEEKFKNDLHKYIDDTIIGALTSLVIGLILKVAGVAVVTGGMIVLVVLVCVIVSSILGYILEKNNISFSAYIESIISNISNFIHEMMSIPAPAPIIA